MKEDFTIPRKKPQANADGQPISSDAISDAILRNNPPPPGTDDINLDTLTSPLVAAYGPDDTLGGYSLQNPIENGGTFDKDPGELCNDGGQQKGDVKRKASVFREYLSIVLGGESSSECVFHFSAMAKEEGLPTELTKLILPLSCELCKASLNSPVCAKMHYESKNHDKKVNAWLADWSKRTGEPVPKRQKVCS